MDTKVIAGDKSNPIVQDDSGYLLIKINGVDLSSGKVPVELEAADIQIGAVEIKNSDTDDRVKVSDADTARATTDHVLLVQNVDADGEVMDVTDLVSIKTNTDNLDDTISNLRIDIQAVETDVEATNTALGTVNTNLGTIETDVEAINTHLGTIGEVADVDGAVHGQLRYIGEAVDGLENSVNTPQATYKSPTDLTAAYTSNVSITLSGVPFTITDSSQIVYIKTIPTTGNARIYVNGINGVTITESTNVLTIAGAGTPFAVGDVYEVGINEQEKAYDVASDSIKSTIENPQYSRYTNSVVLVSAQDLTDSYADFGAEIDMKGYNKLGLYLSADVNLSENVSLKVLGKHESAGADEYEIDGLSVQELWTTGATDFKKYYSFDTDGTIPYLQIQAIAATVGATAGTLSIVITKSFI